LGSPFRRLADFSGTFLEAAKLSGTNAIGIDSLRK